MKKTKLEKIEEQIASLELQKIKLKNATVAKCTHCHKGTQISKLVYYQPMYYVAPYSCTGGDYWEEYKDESLWVCPKCNKFVWLIDFEGWRAIDNDNDIRHPINKQAAKLRELKYYFKQVKKIYNR